VALNCQQIALFWSRRRLTISTEFPVKPGAMLIEVLELGGARDRGWGCLPDRRRDSDCISLHGLVG